MQLISVAVIERDDLFLVGLRPTGVPLAGYHEFPGGKQQPGESSNRTAERECLEETGLHVSASRLIDQKTIPSEQDDLMIDFWQCQLLSQGDQHPPAKPWEWIERDQLCHLNFPPANAEVVTLLISNSLPDLEFHD